MLRAKNIKQNSNEMKRCSIHTTRRRSTLTLLNVFRSFGTEISNTHRKYRVGIVGGGAAGLMCALWAQRTAQQQMMTSKHNASLEIVLLERKQQCGKKILMSGGTRCNVLPHVSKWPLLTDNTTEEDMFSPGQSILGNRFFTQQPEILRDILKTWPITDQKDFFEDDLRIALSLEADTGKYFPKSNDAREVLEAFLSQLSHNKHRQKDCQVTTKIMTNSNVEALERIVSTETGNHKWKVKYREDEGSDLLKTKHTNKSSQLDEILFDKLIVATGGLSVINKDGTGIQLLQKLGHRIVPLYAALTPLLSHQSFKLQHKELSGLSSQKVKVAAVWLDDPEQTTKGQLIHRSSDPNAFLFTHRGYSGPAVLNISHHTIVSNPSLLDLKEATATTNNLFDQNLLAELNEHDSIENLMYRSAPSSTGIDNKKLFIEINWTPDISFQDWDHLLVNAQRKGSKQQVKNFVHKNCQVNFLPMRLIQLLMETKDNLGDLHVSQLTKDQRQKVINQIVRYRVAVGGNEGLKKAEVTGGGVDLRDIQIPSLASKVQPNLHICGEALDAFGCIGGFNFAFSWITGRLAGTSAVSSLLQSSDSNK